MALTVQNLRAVGVGVEPASLLPGQVAFNITDKVIYVGDGSNLKTNFDGTQVAGVPGNGWYAMPMDFDSLGEYYVANPGYYGDVPTDGQVLTWSTALNHTIWSNGAGGGSQVYVVSNAAVAAAPGATTSAKITAAIGVVSPDEGNVTIVTGLPDDVYEGLYFFTTEWVKGAAYAYPSASEVIYDNTAHPSLGATVQLAISDLDDGLAATTAIANTANSTANSALSIASAALPKAGGVMTGDISFGSVGTGIIFNDSSNIRSISDSATSVSSVTAGSSTAVKTAYDLAAAAVPRSSYTAPGDLVVGTGVGSFNALAVGTPGQILAVAPGGTSLTWVTDSEGDVTGVSGTLPITINNTNPQIPVVGVNLATTTSTGVVQVGSNIDLGVGGVISVKSSTTTQAGIVQLNNTLSSTSVTEALTANQGRALSAQISALTISGTTTLAGSINASNGLVQTVTTQGALAGFTVGGLLPAPGPSNNNYYVLVTSPGTFTPPSSPPVTSENGDWILSNSTVWNELEVGSRPSYASTTVAGIVQLADNAATQAGTDGTLAVTPLGLQSKLSDSTSTTSSTTIASSTAVKSAYDLANAALPKAGGTMTGDITMSGAGVGVVFNDASTVEAISDSISTTSSVTAASSTAAKAAYDVGAAAIPCSLVIAKGNIVSASAAGTPVALPVGTNGQVLVANSACSAGLEWVTDVPGDVTSVSGTAPITVNNTNPQTPIVGIDAASTTACGAVQLNDTVTSASTSQAATANAAKTAFDKGVSACTIAQAAVPCASFTSLGQILTGTGTSTYSALNVGTNGQFLSANSACGTGLEWCTLSLACVPCSAYTAVGTILAGNGAGTYCSLPIGTNGQILVPNSACAAGVEWVSSQGITLCGYTCTLTPFNTALGFQAGDSITSGTSNVALGFNALTAVTTTSLNVAVGCGSMAAATGAQNVSVGANALCSTLGSNGVAVGYLAGRAATAGSNNTFVGSSSGTNIVGGGNNTTLGYNSLGASSTGVANTAIGFQAMGFGAGSTCNVAIGFEAGRLLAGSSNTLVGCCAGSAVTTGSCNVIVGGYAGTATLARNVVLADGAGTIRFQANSSGAWSADGTNFGTAGQVLSSNGTVAAPVWCTLSLACIPCSAFTAAGQLLAGTGSSTFAALTVGTNGQFLSANSACSAGLEWCTLSLACVPCSAFTAAGQLLAGTGTSTFTALSVGTNGQVLIADSACTSGVKWGASLQGYTCTATPFNTALGGNAGDSVTSGTDNVTLGYNAGTAITTGSQNVVIGSGAAVSSNSVGVVTIGFCSGQALTTAGCVTHIGYISGRNSTGLNNTYVGALTGCAASNTSACGTLLGFCAGSALTTGNGNILVGFQAGRNVNSGANNVAIGTAAFQTATTATNNVAVGCGALSGLSTSSGNTALGHRAMLNASTAANNVAIGCNAGEQLSTGSNNVLIGDSAGDTITTGTQNTFVGSGSGGLVATTSEGNTAVGFSALGQGVTSGAYNVAVGTNAGLGVTSGAINTLVGFSAGSAITTGGSNTLVGRYAGTAALSNNVVLSDGAGTIRFQSNASGAISLGTGGSYGTAGQILVSGGSGAAPTWTSSGTAAANYGSFVRTTTQTNAGGASGNAVSYDTTSSANNFSIVSGSRITAAVAGTYQILASLQVQKTDAGTDDVNFWIKKNGVNEPNSAYNLTLQGSGAAQLGYINWVVTLAAGEYVELWWYSADANARLLADPAVAPYPAVPASGFIIHPMGA